MPSAGFEYAIPAKDRPQTDTLDRMATRIGCHSFYNVHFRFVLLMEFQPIGE
jgi:hypothetical protein